MDGQYQLEDNSELKGVLSNLARGETLTLTDERGEPLAVAYSVKTSERTEAVALKQQADHWIAQMKALAAKVDAAWQGEKSGLEELAEMRR